MTVEEWFASRDAAYDAFEAVEADPDSGQDDIDAAWQRFHEVRTFLNRWKRGEGEEWREEWREVQRQRIGGLLSEMRGGVERWEQDGLEGA